MSYLRWPYPEPPASGYWGKPSSLIDWCEENYVVSSYMAEWSNTLTNTIFLVTAAYSIYTVYRNKLEFRFVLVGLGFGTVGIGSWLFHMTLQYRFQLLDELPMLYATIIPSWSIFCENAENWLETRSPGRDAKTRRSQSLQIQVGFCVILSTLVTLLTYVYIELQQPLIFQVVYGVLTVLVVILSGWLTYFRVNDKDALKDLLTTMILGVVPFVVGFLCWNLDVHFCSFWIYIRRNVLALPLGVFLELHGWWHLLTGMGVYIYLVYLHYLRVLTQGQKEHFIFIYRFGWLPELVRKGITIRTPYSKEFWGPLVDRQVKKD